MATRNENIICTALGAGTGLFLATQRANKLNLSDSDKFKSQLLYTCLGGLAGYGLSELFGTTNDTRNYKLVNESDEILYHGIAYDHRTGLRKKEHLRNGKEFSDMILSSVRPRKDALRIERKLIKQDRPVYNIQHNN